MTFRDETRSLITGMLVIGAGVCAAPASGQELSDTLESVSGSASVYGEVVHTRIDTDSGSSSNTKPAAGVSGSLGGSFRSGANELALRYGGNLSTKRDLPTGDQTDSSSLSGASRYQYLDEANPLDFNLGHTIQSVRNNTGFLLNAGDYDTRNTLSAGAGLTFYPGDVSSLRLSTQAGKSYGSGDLENNESYTVSSAFSRRLTERSSATLTARRSWSENQGVDTTIDTAELGYSLSLENGFFSIGGGKSWSETEFPGQATNDSDAMTGHLTRTWISPETSTSVQYNRRLSDSTTDLSLNLPPEFLFLPDTVQLRDLVVSDSVSVSHNTARLCDVCSFTVFGEAAQLDSQLSDTKTYEYSAAMNLGVDLTNLHQLQVSYGWQGDSGVDTGKLRAYTHRLNIGVTRRLAEDVRVGVQLRQTWVRRIDENRDEDQYGIRLFLTRDFSLTSRR